MEFIFEQKKDTLYVSFIGDLDNYHAEEFKAHLKILLKHEFKELILNLDHVPFISSSIIGKLIVFYKDLASRGRKMRIEGLNQYLYELLQSIKLDLLLPLAPASRPQHFAGHS